jgi:ABC-type multidrug transport system fused ATPase/permease subunit
MIITLRNLWWLLNRRERVQFVGLLAAMLVVGIVEIASVVSIFPLIAVISNPTLVNTNRYLHGVYSALGFSDQNSFLVFLALVMFAVVIGRTAVTTLSSYAILRFASGRSHVFASRLLGAYLSRSYEWLLGRNTADLANAMLVEAEEVVNTALLPSLQLISQIIVGVCIVGIVMIADPTLGLIAALSVGAAYAAIYLCVRNWIGSLAHTVREARKNRFRIAQEVFGGAKEVKLGSLEVGYMREFTEVSLRMARGTSTQLAMMDLPRQLLEALAIGGMLAVIIGLLVRHQGDLNAVLPVIALYGFAGLRLLPVVQVVYRSLLALRASGPYVEALVDDLKAPVQIISSATVARMALTEAIELKNVSYSYPQSDRQALRNVDLTIRRHSSVAFIGKTGAGKTTVVDIVLGLLTPQTGDLKVDGHPINEANLRSWQSVIGYVPQQIFLTDDTVTANIAFGVDATAVDMDAVRRAAHMASVAEFVESELPQGYNTKVGERGARLSGGQRQRIGIARALYRDPDVIVFDEATSALDVVTEQVVMDAVRNLANKKTIILIAHRLATVMDCDTIFLMDEGKIVDQGSYQALSKSSGIFGEMINRRSE